MPTVLYIKTTGSISYLTARQSRDVVLAAHQALTRGWWRGRSMYQLRVSQLVIDEASAGDSLMRARRLRAMRGIVVLPLTDAATRLAKELVRRRSMPEKATVDAFHIGVAAAHGAAYLLTWNCEHLAGTGQCVVPSKPSVALKACVLQSSVRAEELPSRMPVMKQDAIIRGASQAPGTNRTSPRL